MKMEAAVGAVRGAKEAKKCGQPLETRRGQQECRHPLESIHKQHGFRTFGEIHFHLVTKSVALCYGSYRKLTQDPSSSTLNVNSTKIHVISPIFG